LDAAKNSGGVFANSGKINGLENGMKKQPSQ